MYFFPLIQQDSVSLDLSVGFVMLVLNVTLAGDWLNQLLLRLKQRSEVP